MRRPASLSRSLTSPHEFSPIAVLGIIAPGLLGFAQRADEVFEQETHAFEIAVLTFLRLPKDTFIPIGPAWPLNAMTDITALCAIVQLHCDAMPAQSESAACFMLLAAAVADRLETWGAFSESHELEYLIIRAFIERGQKSGLIRPEIDADAEALMAGCSLLGLRIQCLIDPAFDPAPVRDALVGALRDRLQIRTGKGKRPCARHTRSGNAAPAATCMTRPKAMRAKVSRPAPAGATFRGPGSARSAAHRKPSSTGWNSSSPLQPARISRWPSRSRGDQHPAGPRTD